MNIPKVLRRKIQLTKHYPKDDFLHLRYVGILEKHQGKSIGTKLLKEVIKDTTKPIVLETSTLRNLSLYEKLGFEI